MLDTLGARFTVKETPPDRAWTNKDAISGMINGQEVTMREREELMMVSSETVVIWRNGEGLKNWKIYSIVFL